MEIGEPGGYLVWLTDVLDSVVRFGRTYRPDPGPSGSGEDVFESVSPVVAKLLDHEGIAFMTVRPDGVEFNLSYVTGPADSGQIDIEIRHQISEGVFAWALYHNGPVIVPSANGKRWLLLHVLATPGRVWGMFIAVLTPPSPFVPDVSQKLLSLVLSEVAAVLESRLLQRPSAGSTARPQEMVDVHKSAWRRSAQAARGSGRAGSTSLARASDEMRTALNGVAGMAGLLLDSELEADQRLQAERIQQSAEDLLEMINQILEAGGVQAGGAQAGGAQAGRLTPDAPPVLRR